MGMRTPGVRPEYACAIMNMIMRRRGIARVVIISLVLCLSCLITYVSISMIAADTTIDFSVDFTAPSVDYAGVDFDSSSERWAIALNGKTVANKNGEVVAPTASTAKMIMALAVMEKKPFELGAKGETITIDADLYERYSWYISHNGSNSKVALGEEISEYDALAAAMVVSSNNMADGLAIWAFGSLEAYGEYANEMVKRLGAKNTTIGVDASGFDLSTTSTASDLALIGEKVLENPVLNEIVNLKEIDIPVAGHLTNTNKILGKNGLLGVKTGYIGDESGYCLVSGYKEGDELITIAMLGAPERQDSFDDTEAIVEKAREAIKTRELVGAGQQVGHYSSWWIGDVAITTNAGISGVAISDVSFDLDMDSNELRLNTNETHYSTSVSVEEFAAKPTLKQRFLHAFGWSAK
jgi:D-alanyl-D-alanine carboxypeptidase (penicillin-binding protein 5/6)